MTRPPASAETRQRQAPVPKARAVRPKKTKSAEELEIPKLLNIGYGNVLVASRVIAVVSSQSAPMRRLRALFRKVRKLRTLPRLILSLILRLLRVVKK